jgi:hypothetical protein
MRALNDKVGNQESDIGQAQYWYSYTGHFRGAR